MQPGAEAFATNFALESLARAVLVSVIPIDALRLLGDAQAVSTLFFCASLIGLAATFLVPWLIRKTARRLVYTMAVTLLFLAPAFLAIGNLEGMVAGMMLRVLAVVSMTICISLYIMDHIARRDLSRAEPKRIFYSAGAWTLGPVLGVGLSESVAAWAPYALSSACALVLIGHFWILRLTDRKIVAAQRLKVPQPHRSIQRFLAQPRLVTAWLIAIGRNAWWAMFFIYTPIFAVSSGLGSVVGGATVSAGTSFLFLLPLWAWCLRRYGLRRLLMTGFTISALATVAAALLTPWPWLAIGALLLAALAMVAIDAGGNLPFMLAVRPSERSAMTAVYSTYRDMAEITTPGLFALLLKSFALPVVFLAAGGLMLGTLGLSRRLHPRLALVKARPQRTLAATPSRAANAPETAI